MEQRKIVVIIFVFIVLFFHQHISFVMAEDTDMENEWCIEEDDEVTEENMDYEQLEQDDIDGTFSVASVVFMKEEHYIVTVPKNIVLGEDGMADFKIQIKGNISPDYCIQVKTIDMIGDRAGTNFYLTNALFGRTSIPLSTKSGEIVRAFLVRNNMRIKRQ